MTPPFFRRLHRVRESLKGAIGDIAFGMEDGAVSIAGLVFGVAASTSDAHIVLLAGSAGAVAGAVSMMAGTYLDVESSEDRARARVAALDRRVRADPAAALAEMRLHLGDAGFTAEEISVVDGALMRNPESIVRYARVTYGGPKPSGESAVVHAAWMFLADIVAASVPVLPFALLDITAARVASLTMTTALLLVLGVGRALIAHRSIALTAAQTLAIAGAAAFAGVVIGRLVTAWTG